MALCWNRCGREYHDYAEDPKNVLRCPSCGELEQDDPAKKKAPVKRATAKPKE